MDCKLLRCPACDWLLVWRYSWKRGNEDSVQSHWWGAWNWGSMEPGQTQWGASHAGRFAAALLRGSSPQYPQASIHLKILHFLDWYW